MTTGGPTAASSPTPPAPVEDKQAEFEKRFERRLGILTIASALVIAIIGMLSALATTHLSNRGQQEQSASEFLRIERKNAYGVFVRDFNTFKTSLNTEESNSYEVIRERYGPLLDALESDLSEIEIVAPESTHMSCATAVGIANLIVAGLAPPPPRPEGELTLLLIPYPTSALPPAFQECLDQLRADLTSGG